MFHRDMSRCWEKVKAKYRQWRFLNKDQSYLPYNKILNVVCLELLKLIKIECVEMQKSGDLEGSPLSEVPQLGRGGVSED